MKSGNSSDTIYKEVVIIGNGPSGIALSYMLSGNLPFLMSDSHPDEMLSMRLRPGVNQCLVRQDLLHLATGLEGRSTNPVSLLLDALLHPCADVGLEMAPLVEFKRVGAEIDHVVLGNGPPGGSWHKMDPYILTLSLGSWMSLPGLPYTGRDSGEKRAFAYNVANYYVQYVKEKNLSKYFMNNFHVSKVRTWKKDFQRIIEEENPDFTFTENNQRNNCPISNAFNFILSRGNRNKPNKPNRCSKRPREQALCQGQSPDRKTRDRSISLSSSCDANHCDDSVVNLRSSHSLETIKNSSVPFRIPKPTDAELKRQANWVIETQDVESGEPTIYHCKYLVLANGANDLPNKLDFSHTRRDPDWMFHDLRSLENALDQILGYEDAPRAEDIDPVLIVGAGLSAADAVIASRGRNVPVAHVFRNKSGDLNRQLPENMYPEYHKVHQMMVDGGSTYPLYIAYPEYNLTDIDEASHSVILTSKDGDTVKIRVSLVAVLIGSRPDLTFLPGSGFSLAAKKGLPIDCKTNTLAIDKLTHCVHGFDNLFAIGPLAGDNFVRFIPGGALAVVAELYKRNDYFLT